MTERWRAEMPPRHLGRVNASELTCHADDVDELVTRANAELDAAEARERAKDEQLAELEAEATRLRKLFDDAGQGEYNVLALVDHYQSVAIESDEKVATLEAELATYEKPTCNGSWVDGSGAHRKFGGCGKPANWRDDGGACFCDEHLPAHERIAALEARIRELEDDLGRIGEEMGLPRGIVPADGEFLRMRNLLRDSLQRIKELTEWRPMGTAPSEGEFLAELFSGRRLVVRRMWIHTFLAAPATYLDTSEIRGWLPLPSTEGGEG